MLINKSLLVSSFNWLFLCLMLLQQIEDKSKNEGCIGKFSVNQAKCDIEEM